MITARLHPPGKGEVTTVKQACRRDQLPAAAEALTQGIARALKQEPMRGAWAPGLEAEQFWREAQWALRTGLYLAAERAAEASWALGLRTAEVMAARARGELLEARPRELPSSAGGYLWEQSHSWRADLQRSSRARHSSASSTRKCRPPSASSACSPPSTASPWCAITSRSSEMTACSSTSRSRSAARCSSGS